MTKLQFEDLTQIACPFGMLDDDTQERLKACGRVEFYSISGEWIYLQKPTWESNITYRAKPQPKRVVTWFQWDDTWGVFDTETLGEAKRVQKGHGGYIYKIERDEDGSNPTIELVETSSVAADNEVKGGKDE